MQGNKIIHILSITDVHSTGYPFWSYTSLSKVWFRNAFPKSLRTLCKPALEENCKVTVGVTVYDSQNGRLQGSVK